MDNETLRMKLGEAWEVYAGRVLPIMTPRSLTGEGTEQSPYRIATFDDWHRLATNVYLGESYKDKYFLMTNDISTSRLVGAQPSTNIYNAFGGIFDGGGHTLTLNYTTDAEFCGPFCYTYGATIRNLITSGTINTSQKHAGGVVGRNGTSLLKLSNVTSSMTINSSFRGSAEHGGLVGYAISANIIGSAFTGSLLGENSNGCGGLVGWKTNTDDSSVSITDCLFAPSSVTVGTANAYTLVRNSSGGTVNVTNSYYTQAVITDLQPGTYYACQVVGIVDEDSYPSAVAVLQTDEEEPQVNHVSVTPGTTSAKVNWEGYGCSYNVRYAIDMATENTAKVTLTVGDVWGDGSGYQMLLDQDANTFGRIIPTIGPLTDPGSASAEYYAEFEYKIPEYADGELTTKNIVFNGSAAIDIPAGTYDWCITNPSPELEMIFIASAHGNIGGRKDNYVFEAGKHYEFTVSLDGDYDRVDLVTTPMYGEWNQQTVESGELTALLSGLTKGTRYVVQVQAVLDNGKTSEWSPVEQFTTLDDGAIVLNDDLDNSTVIEDAAASDQLYDVTLADRTFYKDGSWNTLCLPFDASIDDAPLVGATVMELDTDGQNGFDTADGTLYLTFKPASAIKAGVPYLVKWTSGTDINNPVFEGVSFSGTEAQPVVSATGSLETVQMVGTYSPVSVMADDKSILYLESDNTLCYPAVDLQIRSCRAYFSVPYIQEHAKAQARAFVLSFDGEETGIETISTPSNPSNSSNSSNPSTPYFTLDGRRLNKPSSPGLYIHNGRKVLIK